ncbi:uncharacterized protein LOC107607495 [Arachis ipaensis]|uniref:uncharacterized protein LOC107607495 n=1 Tax=Arachis ipaensis TaxID=130454 RepID=UPI0007AF6ED4|nr:uncharacterized protein LOC107607495 [Arachis ipaensis]
MTPSPATRLLCFSFRLSATSSPRRPVSFKPSTTRSPSSLLDARRSIPLGSGSSCAAVQADENCCLEFRMASSNTPSETPTPTSQEQGSTPDPTIGTQKNSNRGKTDPAWGHCKQVLDKGKTTLVYIYCEKHIKGGGINRVKHHLAGKGGDIEACRKVPAAVRHQFSQNIEDLQTKKRKTQEEYAESYGACDDVEREFDEIEPTPSAQPSIKSVLQSKEIVEKCDIAIARWMMDASVPFNAVNSAYYQPMIDAIANMGVGYKGPNYQRVRGYLLSKLVEDVKKMIEGTVFLKSVDASHISKAAEALFKLLRDVMLFVGLENVVHDIGKFVEVTETVSQASMITKYIYNHCHPLYLMRQFTGGREILRPAPTRFATNFIALQSILAQKNALRAMVTSRE